MKKILLVVIALALAAGIWIGYYFGYDIGWEKALKWQTDQPGALTY